MYALDDYDYELSEDRIAQNPCQQRDRSLLLHLNRRQIYSEESLMALGEVLTQKAKSFGRTIYLMADLPYTSSNRTIMW
jgi:S-adenosylmethionine:tRNA-ribosyltransferase-isomerase (queuine synthetase)